MDLPQTFIKELNDIVGKKALLTEGSDTWTYGYDNSRKHAPPDAVALPNDLAQVQAIVKVCYENQVPLTCRGRASGTTGGAIPIHGGLVLALERLDKIIDFDPTNRIMVVEPGVLNETIQKKASKKNYFFGPDPSSGAYCTIGGNLACNAAGPRSIKYGSTRDNVLGLEAILGNGELLKTGVHTTKGVVGYDFTRLLIGSEDTLGVITQATLKLLPMTQAKQTIAVMYHSIDSAVDAIVKVMSQPIVPCALEMMDEKSLDIIRNHQKVELPLNAKAMLILEVDGSEASLNAEVETVVKTLKNRGLLSCEVAKSDKEAQKLWAVRKALSPALRSLSPHKINEDVVVPISQMPALFNGIEAISTEYDIPIVNFGHGGNGNIHVNMLADPLDEQKGPLAHKALNQLFDLVVSLGGTLSGEHGVGIEKRDFIDKEIDDFSLSLMHQIKAVFDPKGIMNPGKLLPNAKSS